MSILPTLIDAYRNKGYLPISGYNPYHMFNWRDAPFTVFLETANNKLVGQPGLALQEIMFLEALGEWLEAENCLIIGNAMGWSTVATALIFPGARTIGMDNDSYELPTGRELTNEIFEALSLNGGARFGESPNDTAKVRNDDLTGPVDFVLIDAVHTCEAVVEDFRGVRPVCSPGCVYLFHDVLNHKMVPGFKTLIDDSGLTGRLLTKTPSGMAIAYSDDHVPVEFKAFVDIFSDGREFFEGYRGHAQKLMDPM